MLNKTSILVVFDRKKQATKSTAFKAKEGAIQLSITVNQERRFLSTGISVFADQWANGAVINRPDAMQLNEKLQNYLIQVSDVINKCDRVGNLPYEFYEFYELGFDCDPIPVSSVHGTGTGDMLDAVLDAIPEIGEGEEEESGIKVAVIGKPNAGKSSLINRIVGEKRLIVSNIPGTTRDAVDTVVTNQFGTYTFIDTAGIRRQAKIKDAVEHYSVLRSHTAVDRADVCLIMIDAAEGITEQDEKIAGIAHEAGKAVIIVINKWDAVDKDNSTVNSYTKDIRIALGYMTYAPIIYVSALTGQRCAHIYELINKVYAEARKRVTTGMLNDLLNDAMTRVQPPSDKGRRLKIYYMTQVAVKPPTFVIFVNDKELFHFSYQR